MYNYLKTIKTVSKYLFKNFYKNEREDEVDGQISPLQ